MSSAAALPVPPVPAHVDLQDFEYMPVYAARLRDSKMVTAVSAEAFRSAILLWCAAWHQVPAGSLPADDDELAQLAGYGFVVAAWRKVKKGALRGFVLCADGRLHHPVLAERVLESWDAKQRRVWARECDRLRKENIRRREDGRDLIGIPTFDDWKSGTYTPGFGWKSDGISTENPLKGDGIEGKGIEGKKEHLPAAAPVNLGRDRDAAAAVPPPRRIIDEFDKQVRLAWPALGPRREAHSDGRIADELIGAGVVPAEFGAWLATWLAEWLRKGGSPVGSLALVRNDALAWRTAAARGDGQAPPAGSAKVIDWDEVSRGADRLAGRG